MPADSNNQPKRANPPSPNPSAKTNIDRFDLCVVGSGAVGQMLAHAACKQNLSVAIIESRTPGGTCPNRGCDAKKPFVNAAQLAHATQLLHAAGGGVQPTSMDWATIARFKKSFTDPVGPQTTQSLQDAGVTVIHGHAAFVDDAHIQVGKRLVHADRFVLANGLKPRPLDIPGGEHAIDSDAFLDLDDLPKRVVFIGGGYIGMEFACAAALANRHVTVITPGQQVLTGFDADAVACLEQALPQLGQHGVHVIHGQRAQCIESTPDGFSVFGKSDDGGEPSSPLVTCDLVVNASGRAPNTDGMHLDRADIEHTPRGIVVNEHLQCPGNPRVFAGGDVADNGQPNLIPTAINDGRVLIHNVVQHWPNTNTNTNPAVDGPTNGWQTRSTEPAASVAFTTPMVAGVGLTEAQARETHDNIHVFTVDLSKKKHFRLLGQPHAFCKLVFNQDRCLLGAHLTGPGSDEVINFFAVAVGSHCNDERLLSLTPTYPSVTAAVQAALRKAREGA